MPLYVQALWHERDSQVSLGTCAHVEHRLSIVGSWQLQRRCLGLWLPLIFEQAACSMDVPGCDGRAAVWLQYFSRHSLHHLLGCLASVREQRAWLLLVHNLGTWELDSQSDNHHRRSWSLLPLLLPQISLGSFWELSRRWFSRVEQLVGRTSLGRRPRH